MTDIDIDPTLAPDHLHVALVDRRAATVDLFEGLDPERRAALARDAWSIGLRAISNAYDTARESRLETIGQDLMTTLETKLHERMNLQQERIDGALRSFFDPRDGKVYERLARFVGDDGSLHRQLERFAQPEDGPLAQVLARQVGESSPLFRLLSETDREGLFHKLEERLDEVLQRGRGQLGGALDPAVPDSPISRFLTELKEELRRSGTELDGKLGKALAALDTSDETSLLSRLSRDVAESQRKMLAAVSLQSHDSPLAQLGNGLQRMMKEQAEVQQKLLTEQRDRQAAFETRVTQALERIQAKKEADEGTTRGGFGFEDEVVHQVRRATAQASCIVTATGNAGGAVSRARVGDVVVEFSPDSAFAGSRIVVEAKRDASYNVQRALDEMKRARANREAGVGVFVMERSRAPDGFPVLARHGSDVLVQWDAGNRESDAYLHAAVMLALGLAARARSGEEEARIDALNVLGQAITTEIKRVEKMEQLNRKIGENSRMITGQLQQARGTFEDLLERGQETLKALDVDMLSHEDLSFRQAANEPRAPAATGSGMPVVSGGGEQSAPREREMSPIEPATADASESGPRIEGVDGIAVDADALVAALERDPDGRAGNGRMQTLLGWSDERYENARDLALDHGRVRRGPGRGGSIVLVRQGLGGLAR